MADKKRDPAAANPDPAAAPPPTRVAWSEPEVDNAQEWGTGLHHGRAIARGGKSQGFVEGATEQSP
jgi:hypothetical protein